jgi:tol-pal system protein YbgF
MLTPADPQGVRRLHTFVHNTVRAVALTLTLTAVGGAAQAQLFPDNEARRAIVELREKLEADRKTLSDVNIKQGEQLQQLQRSLLELNNQIETLRAELAKQRGANEQLTREVAELQRKQKDMVQAATEEKARKPEPLKATMDGREFVIEADEKKQFDDALGQLRQGDYAGAANALTNFQKRWPSSGYTDASRFWLGNSLYGKRDYKESLATFKAFISATPDHPRVPEAMLAAANAHLELKDTKSAKALLTDLTKAHPRSEAAQAARERLAVLK